MANISILIGFCNNQIANPHNYTMKKLKPKLQGIKHDVAVTKHVLYDAVKLDLLGIIEHVSMVLQEADLLLPSLFSVCARVIKNIRKVNRLLNEQGAETFKRDDLFPTAAEIIDQLEDEDEEIIPEWQTRADTAQSDGDNCLLNG